MKTQKKVFILTSASVVLLLLSFLIWANTGLGSEQSQVFNVEASESFGDSTSRKNIVGVQAFVDPIDYASEENFTKKTRFYLEEARKKNWLIPNNTVVVFPEYFGTWLVTMNEKESIYAATDIESGLQTMVLRNAGKFLKTYLTSPEEVKDKVKYSVFAMKAPLIAQAYQRIFSSLAKEYQITIVAGSLLLPSPTVENGELKTGNGQLYNISAIFEPDGGINEQLVQKAFPTADELGFICPVNPAQIPVFDIPVGRMGVLICADAWFPEAYRALKSKNVEFVISPSYSNGFGNWQKPWSGYSGAQTPEDAKADIGRISLGQAWVKHAMATRAKTEAGVLKGLNVFLQGNLWNLGADGSTIVLSDSAHATSYIGKSALINLWL